MGNVYKKMCVDVDIKLLKALVEFSWANVKLRTKDFFDVVTDHRSTKRDRNEIIINYPERAEYFRMR